MVAYKVDFNSKNDVELFDLVMTLYSKTVLKKELSAKEATILREYVLNGYSIETKKAICMSLEINIKNLNTVNCSLQKRGFLRPHPTSQKKKILNEELMQLKQVFLDSTQGKKMFIVNFI